MTSTSHALQRRLQLGLGAVRAVTLVWAFFVVCIDTNSGVLVRPVPAFGLLGVLVIWSTAWTVAVSKNDSWVLRVGAVIDIFLAMTVVALDSAFYSGDRPQSFGSAWPLAAVLATGVAAGSTWGLVGGLAVGVAGVASALVQGAVMGNVLALTGAMVLYASGGWLAGWVSEQLQRTAQVAAAAEARAEVGRTLHDGVLQTLAVVQRRSDDPELVELARTQDAELRAFLRGGNSSKLAEKESSVTELLGPALALVESRFGVPVQLVVVDPGTACGESALALAGAAAEAATNASKHSGADEVWVSVDRAEHFGTRVVVHDEGCGFNGDTTKEGDGLRSSVRGRLDTVGGTVAVRSSPGTGCDVTLWAP